ncbi:MAG: hypothetical protein MUF75_06350 [Bacteroidia bacterium]|jgi:hypothetical protein|nr:hypothetical protein [Bacteroidia bacterium]
MKHAFFFTALLFCSFSQKAQSSEVFQHLKNVLITQHPELDVSNKLIALNLWSVSDKNSRESNKAFEKVCSTYAYAKLEGGRNGVLVILINKDNLDESAVIAMGKDGLQCSYKFNWSDVNTRLQWPEKNYVFKATGETLYADLSPETIFSSFQSLISR